MANKIWHSGDSLSADWLMAGLPQWGWVEATIPAAGSAAFMNLPERIRTILRLDKPDLLVTVEFEGADFPAASIELTTTTPHGQHPKQRIPRLIAAAEAGVPAFYVIPRRKRAMSGGKPQIYRLTCDTQYVLNRLSMITRYPALLYEWPDDGKGNLLQDLAFPGQPKSSAPSIKRLFRSLRTCVRHAMAGPAGVKRLYRDEWISSELAKQRAIAKACPLAIHNFPTLETIRTVDLEAFLKAGTAMSVARIKKTIGALPHRIFQRDKCLVFKPTGRLLEHAGDPYVGMLAFFDYAFCRTGTGVEDRKLNLIHMPANGASDHILDEFAPDGYHSYWKNKCPFRESDLPSVEQQFAISHHLQYGCVLTKSKPQRVLGYFADLIVFQDAVLPF